MSERRLRLVDDLTDALNEIDLEPNRLVDVVARNLPTRPGDLATVMFVSDDRAWVDHVAVHVAGADPSGRSARLAEQLKEVRLPVGGQQTGPVIEQGRSLLITSFDVVPDSAEGVGVHDPLVAEVLELVRPSSGLAVPLKVRGEVIGSLGLLRVDADHPLGADDLELAQALADRVAPFVAMVRRDAALRASEARYRRLTEQSPDIIYRFDLVPEPRLVWVSPAVQAVTGYSPAEFVERQDLFRHLVDAEAAGVLDRVLSHPENALSQPPITFGIRHRQGHLVHVESRLVPVVVDGTIEAVEGYARDITELRRTQEALAHRAAHDSLTGLPNRSLFLEELEKAVARLDRHPGTVGVLFFDLNRFKEVNDRLGHVVGDRLLKAVADRLRRVMRPADVVARLGGDEFGVLVVDADSAEAAVRVATRLLESLSVPVDVGEHEIPVSVSIGIAHADGRDHSVDDLLRDADIAMYSAKAAGNGRYEVFDEHLRASINAHLDRESALLRALEEGDLGVVYQPVVAIASGRVAAVEALLRWTHDGTVHDARSFIGLAEESGVLVSIEPWLVERIRTDVDGWSPSGPLEVHINLSARQLLLPDLTDHLTPPPAGATLSVDVAEATLASGDHRAADARLAALRALGVGVNVDDFGTGPLSLSRLRDLPVTGVKIDGVFLRGIGTEARATDLLAGMVAVGRSLGLEVTGEGVETPEALEALTAMGCDRAQGFHVGRPMAAAEVATLLLP